MPKILEAARPLVARDGVLIKQRDLRDSLRAARIVADARRRAQRIVATAEAEGAEYRRQAYLQAYGQGLLAGAGAMLQTLSDANQLQCTLMAGVETELKALLQKILPQPALALSLVDDWLEQRQFDASALEVHVPRAWSAALVLLEQRFAELPGARLVLHDASHFVLKNGNQIYEFSPEASAGALQRQVLRRIGQERLPAACSEISRAALATLWQHWQAHDADSTQEQT